MLNLDDIEDLGFDHLYGKSSYDMYHLDFKDNLSSGINAKVGKKNEVYDVYIYRVDECIDLKSNITKQDIIDLIRILSR